MRAATTEFADAVRSGVAALLRYKLRTTLSVLGVVLGVAGVVAMVSVGEGARRETLAQVQALGLDNIVARSRIPSAPGVNRRGLRLDDAARIQQLLPAVVLASPLAERHVRLHGASQATLTTVLGVGSQFNDVLRLRLADGRFLSAVDERQSAAVCVIGATLASRLDDGLGRMVGKHVRLGTMHCRIIGVLQASGRETSPANDPAWRNLDDAALVPVTALTGRSTDAGPDQRIDEIWLSMADADSVEPAAQMLARALTAGNAEDAAFDIIVPRQLLAQRQRTHRTFNVVTASIAALALLVGGIGVMNVMLMSVVERTYEIGVRRAVGARRSAIRNQFLVEALLMTIGGGIAGIACGVLLSHLITWYAGWPTSISAGSIAGAVGVSVVVGIGFGLYPAITAARLIPMEALRRE
jgi:putative ABC transport system permease protein